MKKLVFCLLLVLPLLIGCKADGIEAWYGFFDTETMVLIHSGDSLLVLELPDSLVQGYMMHVQMDRMQALSEMLQLPSGSSFGTNETNLATLRELTTTLVCETLGVDRTTVTAEQRLQVLKKHASVLRKTGFVDTLEKLTGFSGGLELLEDVKYCHAYDVGQFITMETSNDWEALTAYLRQWLAGALLFT